MVSPYASRHQVVSLHLQRLISTPDQPTSTHRNYPGTASNPVRAYCPNGRQCRRKADLDFLAFCVLEETTRTTTDDLDENGAERPRLPRAIMDRRSRPGPEPTTLEAVGNQWRYALVVVQAGEQEEVSSIPTRVATSELYHNIWCERLVKE